MKTLAHKTIALTTLLVTFTATSIGLMFYNKGTDILVQHALGDLSLAVERDSLQITAHLRELENDTLFLANTPPVQALIRAGSNPLDHSSMAQWPRQLERIFSTLLGAKPQYLQARLLDANGREWVRVERHASGVLAIPQARLQDKSTAPYSRDTLRLKPGQLYPLLPLLLLTYCPTVPDNIVYRLLRERKVFLKSMFSQ